MKKAKISTLLLIGLLSLTACGGMGQPAQKVAESALDHAGCKLSQSELWNSLQSLADSGETPPSEELIKSAFKELGAKRGLSGPAFDAYVEAFIENYKTIIGGIQSTFGPASQAAWKKALAEAEIGIQVTPAHEELQTHIQKSMADLASAEQRFQSVCANPDQPIETQPEPITVNAKTIWDQLLAQGSPEVYGARKTLAIAYQSCDVLSMKPITNATPGVQGIEIIGRHPAGGLKRKIASLASVNATHPYIKNNRLAQNGCFEVRNSPMIYDFGGKPYTNAQRPDLLNMFKNAGTGTDVLGIDCSAYVFSALAIAGLKLDPDPNKVLKADLVHGVGSRAFKEPQYNGLRCLQKIKVTKTKNIVPGDIVAINGHVVMIDAVGADPFGLESITQAADCSNVSSQNFSFTIAQSSPSKNGVGINRFRASDYLEDSATFKAGLEAYARAACRAKFGLSPNIDSPDLSIVRHKKTPECMAEPLVEQNESCVAFCQAI